MASKGAEYKTGIVVLLGLVILALGLFLVSGGADQFKDKKSLTVLFRDGGGIGAGDAVYLAGRRVGKVTSVTEKEDTIAGRAGTYVAVEIEVYKDSKVHTDSRVTVSKTVTGIVTMNIEYGKGNELAPEGSKLPGEKLATFVEAIDKGEQLLEGARKMVVDVNELVLKLDKAIAELDIPGLGTKARKLLDELNEAAVELKGIVQRAGTDVDAVLAGARGGARNFETLTGDISKDWRELAASLKTTLASAEKAAKDLQGILKENRPVLKLALQRIADGALRVAPVLARIEGLVQAAESLVIDISPKLSTGLRSASTAFKNFEAVTEELRTAPWKLINEPSYDEVLEVHLYNAARSFVKSAENIQEVVDELDALRKQDALGHEGMREKLEQLTARLDLSLKNYDKREKELVALLERAKKED